ncbi:MAG: autotransporter-associated beta strand repeat-containing protein [Thermoguttaceae bacterium]
MNLACPLTITSGYTLYDAGTLNASVVDNGSLVFDGSTNQTCPDAISGTGTVTVSESAGAIVTVSGVNTYSGTTSVTSGTLDEQATDSLPGYNSKNHVSVLADATLAVMVGGTGDWNSNSCVDDIATLLSNVSFDNASWLGIDTTDGSYSYGGTLTNQGNNKLGLAVLGGNTLTVTGINSYTGGTTVVSGTLDAQSPAALPGYNSSGQVTVDGGATLAVMVGGTTDWNSAPGSTNISALLGAVTFDTGSYLGFDTTDGNFTYTTSIPAGNEGLAVLGDNTLTLNPSSGSNNYGGGTEVLSGTLEADSAAALPGYSSAGVVSVADGATLAVLVGGGDWTSTQLGKVLADATFTTGSSLGIDTTGGNFTYTSPIEGANETTLALNLVKLGSNTLTLEPGASGNDYDGTTTVFAGMLDEQSPAALPGYDTSGDVSVAAGATLALMVGGTSDWNSGATDDIATLLANASFATGATLGIDTTDGNFTYSGVIADTSGGSLGLEVLGSNILTVSGANSYSGPTTVTDATIETGAANALPSTTAVTLSGGGLALGGYAQAIAGLAGSGDVTLYDSQLTIDTSTSESCSATIYGSAGSQLIVNGSGTQTLSGSSGNNYTGTIEVGAGAVLDAASPSALGGDSNLGNLTVDDGGTLAAMVGGSGHWAASDIGTLLSSATFSDGASLGFDTSGGNFPYSNAITDTSSSASLGLVVLGNNVLTLSGTNTYSGPTQVLSGTLDAASTAALPSYNEPGQVSVSSGATLAVRVGGTSTWNSSISTLLTDVSFASGASLGFDTTPGSFTCTTPICGAGGAALNFGVTTLGPNVLTLAPSGGSNNYTGATTVMAGSLAASTAQALPAASVLDLAGGAFDPGGSLTVGGLTGTSGTVALASYTLTVDDTTSETYSGTLSGGSGSQLVIASGTQTLSGSNSSFAGKVAVDQGATLDTASAAALGGDTNLANVSVASGGTFAAMVGGSGNWAPSDTSTLLSSASFASGASLGFDTTPGNSTYSNTIANRGGNALGVAVLGTNALTLNPSGSNTYSNGTTVATGATLTMGSAGAVPPNAAIVVNGTLNMNGNSLAVTSLTGSGTVELGSATLTVTAASPDTFSGTVFGTGSVTVNGAGPLTLSGNNDWDGATNVQSGQSAAVLDLESPLTGPLFVSGSHAQVTGTDSPLQATIVSGPAAGPAGASYPFVGSATDAIAANPTNLQLNWNVTNSGGTSVAQYTDTGGAVTFSFPTSGLASGTYTVSLSASDSDATSPSVTREFAVGTGPTASASLSPVTVYSGTSQSLSADASGTSLFYEWSVLSAPSGAQDPIFSVNDSGTASTTTATFSAAGQYELQVTAADPTGQVATSTVSVTVDAVASSIAVIAPTLSLYDKGTEQFTATELDQFGNPMSSQPTSFAWCASSGTITSGGVYTAAGNLGYAYVTASLSSPSLSSPTTALQLEPTPLAIGGPYTVTAGMPYMLSLSSAGLGSDPVTQWTIDWNDGSANEVISGSPLPLTVPHVFLYPGTYDITAQAAAGSNQYSTTINAQIGGQNGQPGQFDPYFPATVPSSSTVGYQTVANLPGGGFIVAGANSGGSAVVASYTATGATDGVSYASSDMSTISSLAAQPYNGGYAIIAAGQTTAGNFGMVRYLSNGTLDGTFDTNFSNSAAPFSGDGFSPQQVDLLANGEVLVGGYVTNAAGTDLGVVRYNANGTLDTTFGNDGWVTAGLSVASTNPCGMALDGEGNIVLAGTANIVDAPGEYEFALARFNSAGVLDTSFGNGGIVLDDFDNHDNHATAVAIESDGDIVVAGYSDSGYLDLLRYQSDGSRDTTLVNVGEV